MNELPDVVTVEIGHLIISDTVNYSEDRRTNRIYREEQQTLWEETKKQYPEYANFITYLKNKLEIAYKYIEDSSRFSNDLRIFNRSLLRNSPRTADPLAEEILTYYCIAEAVSHKTNFFVFEMKDVLQKLGYSKGVLDEGLKVLSYQLLLKKIFELYDHRN